MPLDRVGVTINCLDARGRRRLRYDPDARASACEQLATSRWRSTCLTFRRKRRTKEDARLLFFWTNGRRDAATFLLFTLLTPSVGVQWLRFTMNGHLWTMLVPLVECTRVCAYMCMYIRDFIKLRGVNLRGWISGSCVPLAARRVAWELLEIIIWTWTKQINRDRMLLDNQPG